MNATKKTAPHRRGRPSADDQFVLFATPFDSQSNQANSKQTQRGRLRNVSSRLAVRLGARAKQSEKLVLIAVGSLRAVLQGRRLISTREGCRTQSQGTKRQYRVNLRFHNVLACRSASNIRVRQADKCNPCAKLRKSLIAADDRSLEPLGDPIFAAGCKEGRRLERRRM
ncbi:MAG TPA: hypothetical protein VIH50_05255 [Steroidobacteraceae bacterium]